MSRQDGFGRGSTTVWVLVAALSGLPACAAGPAATQPAAPAAPGQQPAPAEATSQETRPTVDPAAMKVLAALEQAGAAYQSIRADLEMTVLLPALGDREQHL